MRHLVLAAFMIAVALGITSFAASALQSWAMARSVTVDEQPISDVAKHDSRTRESLDVQAPRQGRSRAQSVAGI
jgi:HAMP domain-containing protein